MKGIPLASNVPLSILDLAPVVSGSTPAAALRNTLDLARTAERLGYRRYWLAEHHFAPGVASSAPAVLVALVAAATSTIRVGSGAVQLGYRTPATVVEQFGTIDALHPGRIDLGLGRSGGPPTGAAAAPPLTARPTDHDRIIDGLLVPKPFRPDRMLNSPRHAAQAALLTQPGAQPPVYAEQVDDILALLAGTYRTDDGIDIHAIPGESADLEVWILGSSGGQSATVAAERGLPFGANYHVSPSSVLEAVETYRTGFRPSDAHPEPYVMVSADVVVARDEDGAHTLAAPYAPWVYSIRSGQGAIPFPEPAATAGHAKPWTSEENALVVDRVATQFIGSPETVVEQLWTLQRVTDADELLVTTITHDHADRVRSFELLAGAWHAA